MYLLYCIVTTSEGMRARRTFPDGECINENRSAPGLNISQGMLIQASSGIPPALVEWALEFAPSNSQTTGKKPMTCWPGCVAQPNKAKSLLANQLSIGRLLYGICDIDGRRSVRSSVRALQAAYSPPSLSYSSLRRKAVGSFGRR